MVRGSSKVGGSLKGANSSGRSRRVVWFQKERTTDWSYHLGNMLLRCELMNVCLARRGVTVVLSSMGYNRDGR